MSSLPKPPKPLKAPAAPIEQIMQKAIVKNPTIKGEVVKKEAVEYKSVDLTGGAGAVPIEERRSMPQTAAYNLMYALNKLPEDFNNALTIYTELVKLKKEVEVAMQDIKLEANAAFLERGGQGGMFNGCKLRPQSKRAIWTYSPETEELAIRLKAQQAAEKKNGLATSIIPDADLKKDSIFAVSV